MRVSLFSLLPKLRRSRLILPVALLLFVPLVSQAQQTSVSSMDKDRGHVMLKAVKDDLKKNYYDPNFHGMSVEERFKIADEEINQAASMGQIMGIIAQVLMELNDSHTFFLPPQHTNRVDYGWQMQMIGDKCYIVAIKPGSDAEKKGLKVGDEVFSIDGYAPKRGNFWVMEYLYYALRPRPGMQLVVQSPGAQQREVVALARIRTGKQIMDLTGFDGSDIGKLIRDSEDEDRLHRHRYHEMGEDALIWKMPAFDLPKDKVDDMMDKARKRKALILDLRGNGGGSEETMLRMIANVIDHDVQVGELKRRKESKNLVAKTRGENAFKGKLVVLVDSKSGSAAELFSRVVQLEKRGTIIGDITSGAVMRSKHYPHQLGVDTIVPYGVSITDADIIMSDGKSLEHIGVTPDELMLPAATDLAAKRDPVLARAVELAGFKLDAERAGAMFPVEWLK